MPSGPLAGSSPRPVWWSSREGVRHSLDPWCSKSSGYSVAQKSVSIEKRCQRLRLGLYMSIPGIPHLIVRHDTWNAM